jgi:hypothetical protein
LLPVLLLLREQAPLLQRPPGLLPPPPLPLARAWLLRPQRARRRV